MNFTCLTVPGLLLTSQYLNGVISPMNAGIFIASAPVFLLSGRRSILYSALPFLTFNLYSAPRMVAPGLVSTLLPSAVSFSPIKTVISALSAAVISSMGWAKASSLKSARKIPEALSFTVFAFCSVLTNGSWLVAESLSV